MKKQYIRAITRLLKECDDISLLDLIYKILMKNKQRVVESEV